MSGPSPPIVELDGQAPVGMPERPSPQVHATVTSSLYQPLPFGSVVGAPLMAGAVRSTRRCASVPVPVLPATSWTETGPAVRSPPSSVTTVSPGSVLSSTPEVASLAVQCTVTAELYQPLPFAAVVGEPDTDGAVSSRLIGPTVAVSLLPPLSLAVPVTV